MKTNMSKTEELVIGGWASITILFSKQSRELSSESMNSNCLITHKFRSPALSVTFILSVHIVHCLLLQSVSLYFVCTHMFTKLGLSSLCNVIRSTDSSEDCTKTKQIARYHAPRGCLFYIIIMSVLWVVCLSL